MGKKRGWRKNSFITANGGMRVEGWNLEREPKDGIEVPPLVPHQMRNESDQDVEFLVISQPNSHNRGDRVNK